MPRCRGPVLCRNELARLRLKSISVDTGGGAHYDAVLREIGAIAQLGERYNGIVEVSGSIPLSSTIYSSNNIQESPESPLNAGFLFVAIPKMSSDVHVQL